MMRRIDALRAVHDRLQGCAVVTIMGAVAAELQELGHRTNFFYLQHAMGLAASTGLGIALSRPSLPVVVLDGEWVRANEPRGADDARAIRTE